MQNEAGEPLSRRRFLRQLGTTFAAGVGVALVPSLARADETDSGYQCCPDTTCGPPWQCNFPKIYHRCQCPGSSYCACFADNNCFNSPC